MGSVVELLTPGSSTRQLIFAARREGPRKIGVSNCQSQDHDRISRRREKTKFDGKKPPDSRWLLSADEVVAAKSEKTQQRIIVSHNSNDWFSVVQVVFRDPATIYR